MHYVCSTKEPVLAVVQGPFPMPMVNSVHSVPEGQVINSDGELVEEGDRPTTDEDSEMDCVLSHLEERLLDQAQARASYTPLFWGHSRSIPQGMILDVQPLVKSLFCPIRASPNGFFYFEASTP